MIIKKSKFNPLIFFLYFFTLFPYVTPYSFGTDLQPWYICFAIIIFFIMVSKQEKVNKLNLWLFVPFIVALFYAIVAQSFFAGIRGLLGYLTIAITPIVFKYALERKLDYFISFLKFATIVYFIVACIQLFIDVNFLTFLLNRSVTSAERGVTSLTSEPTYYATVCLFFLFFYFKLGYDKYKLYIYITLFQIVFLSQSTMVLLLLMVLGVIYLLTHIRITTILLSSLFVYISWQIIFFTNLIKKNSRFVNTLEIIFNDPFKIIEIDASVNDRIGSIYYPLKGFFDSCFLPNGFTSYANYLFHELPKQTFFGSVTIADIIKSYYGAALYELGFIGFLIIIIYNIFVIKGFAGELRKMAVNLAFLNLVLLTAVPLTFAIVGVYLVFINMPQVNKLNKS